MTPLKTIQRSANPWSFHVPESPASELPAGEPPGTAVPAHEPLPIPLELPPAPGPSRHPTAPVARASLLSPYDPARPAICADLAWARYAECIGRGRPRRGI